MAASESINPWPLILGAAALGGGLYVANLARSGADLAYEVVSGESLSIVGGMIRGEVKFRLINRGPATLRVKQAALDILVNGNELARIDTSMTTTIPPRESRTVVFPVQASILNSLFLLLSGWLLSGWTPEAQLLGFFRVNHVRIDVQETYDLRINQPSLNGLTPYGST